jgi:hypothetical protein
LLSQHKKAKASGCPLCEVGNPAKPLNKAYIMVTELPSGRRDTRLEVSMSVYDRMQKLLEKAREENYAANIWAFRENGEIRFEIK